MSLNLCNGDLTDTLARGLKRQPTPSSFHPQIQLIGSENIFIILSVLAWSDCGAVPAEPSSL